MRSLQFRRCTLSSALMSNCTSPGDRTAMLVATACLTVTVGSTIDELLMRHFLHLLLKKGNRFSILIDPFLHSLSDTTWDQKKTSTSFMEAVGEICQKMNIKLKTYSDFCSCRTLTQQNKVVSFDLCFYQNSDT